MKVDVTTIPGVYLVHPDVFEDERGSFARTYDAEVLVELGMGPVAQMSVSTNRRRHTLRGLHFQRAPRAEHKLVRCSRGAVYDVVVDARPDSPAFGAWLSVELAAASATGLLVPPGCAHGFMTLADDCEVSYAMDAMFDPVASAGIRYDDPEVGIAWPAEPAVLSDRDRALPRLTHGSVQ